LHALLLVCGGEEQVEVLALELQPDLQRCAQCFQDGFLCQAYGDWGFGGDRGCQGEGFLQVYLGGDDAIDQPQPVGFLCREEAPGQHQLHCQCLAKRARETLGAASPGHDSDVDFGLPKLRRIAGDDHIAEHCQFAASAECISADGGDERLLQRGDALPLAELVAQKHLHRIRLCHLVNIGTGGKCALVPMQYHAADVGIGIECLQRRDELLHQGETQGIELVRAIELYGTNSGVCLVPVDADVLKVHRRRQV